MFEVVSAASGQRRCTDERCRGRQPAPVACEVRTRAWTQKVGDGPVTISRTEQVPLPDLDAPCAYCGRATEVVGLHTEDALGPHQLVRWPQPTLSPGMLADELLPDPTPEPTQAEQIADLQRRVARLEGRWR